MRQLKSNYARVKTTFNKIYTIQYTYIKRMYLPQYLLKSFLISHYFYVTTVSVYYYI